MPVISCNGASFFFFFFPSSEHCLHLMAAQASVNAFTHGSACLVLDTLVCAYFSTADETADLNNARIHSSDRVASFKKD